MKDGFIKVASATPEIRVADVGFNKKSILELIHRAAGEGVKIMCLPELCLTGCTCGDLFLHETLVSAAERALCEILSATSETDMLFAVGLPAKFNGALYNCAAVCRGGKLLGLVPKTNMRGDYETRWFQSGEYACGEIAFAGGKTSFENNAVFEAAGLRTGILWGGEKTCVFPVGAAVLLNPAADCEVMGRAEKRRETLKMISAENGCALVRAGAGEGESTTDCVFAGHSIIAANGALLSESRFKTGLITACVDINELKARGDKEAVGRSSCLVFAGKEETVPLPFVPDDAGDREDCMRIAALGLKKRIEHTGLKNLVIGVSGGLDSTLAMLICVRALDELNIPRENLIAVSMPGFGTTGRTKNNAEALSKLLGASFREIPIGEAVRRHFADIGHDESDHGAVFENAQARERTQVLMDLANGIDGIVVGTGDMSELALGFTTYNGDHMSMYGVNSGIPKTLIRALVSHIADTDRTLFPVLRDILETPISPELLPEAEGGQHTESIVGPYELHDFFLFHVIRWGVSPRKALSLAGHAFKGAYNEAEIEKWLKVFIRRFFSQQFKRSCMPDGVKVVDFSLSPRGGWHMPSDASAALWEDFE